MKNQEKYYSVITKCGHVGKRNYIPIKFAIIAESGKEAAKIARQFPRVKHNHKDAILEVKEIDFSEYLEIIELNCNDPYLKCRSKYEQNMIENFYERLKYDSHNEKIVYDKNERKAKVKFKQKKFKLLEKSSWEESYAY